MLGPYFLPLAILFAVLGVSVAIVRRFPPVVFLAVPVYSITTKVASVAFLEADEVFLIETGLVSADVGATERAVIYNSVALVVALVLFRRLAMRVLRRRELSPEKVSQIISSYEFHRTVRGCSFLLAAQFVNALLSYPYPLPGSGLSRQVFVQNLRFPLIADVVGDLVIFASIIGAATVALGILGGNRAIRIQGIGLSVCHVLYLLLMGQRVNGGILIGGLWLAIFLSVLWLGGHRIRLGRMTRRMLPIVFVIMLLGQADVANRSFAQDADSPLEAVGYRVFALQGGVSYTAEYRASNGDRVGSELLIEDMSTTRDVYMPRDLANAYERRGVNLAGSLHGNSILSLGYFWGLVPLVIYGVCLAVASFAVLLSLARGRWFALFPLSILILRVISVNAQGTFAALLNAQTVILLLAAIVLLAVRRRGQFPVNGASYTSATDSRPAVRWV